MGTLMTTDKSHSSRESCLMSSTSPSCGVCLALAFTLLLIGVSGAHADKVITKDGKVYTGKIMIDSDKAILIGNPPFDPNSTLIQSEDIQTIVYEEYKPNAPAERKRGLTFDLALMGNA